MKKKLLLSMLGLVLIASMTACGKAGEEVGKQSETIVESSAKNSETKEPEQTSAEKETPSAENESTEMSPYLTGTYTTPLEKISVDVPGYKYIEKGYTKVFLDDGVKLVVFTCREEDSSSTPEEAYEQCWAKTRWGVENYGYINEEGHDLTVTEKTVGDIETLYYEGTMRLDRSEPHRTAQTYGYAFTFLGHPCLIWGYVVDKDQPQDQIDEIKNVVDAMVESVRAAQ